MDTITIPAKQYQNLLEKAFRYDYLAGIVQKKEALFAAPPVKKVNKVVEAFETTGLYSPAFLKSLKNGLKRSSYFQN